MDRGPNQPNHTRVWFDPRFTTRYGTWIVIAVGILAAFGLLLSPTIATALWLSAGVLVIMLAVHILARLRQTTVAGEESAS